MSQNSSLTKSFKEMTDNPMPLSPQWLLPKPGLGDNNAAGENRPDVTTSPVNGNAQEITEKKKDVFRPTFMDAPDSGRRDRDRWRDEERDTVTLTHPNPSARRDRRIDGDKDMGDGLKNDNRWIDNSPPIRNFRRGGDPSRENSNYDQRRENKWNSRWGPDDKQVDKWSDGHDKGKDETREGDHYRPWRPASLQGRAKADQTPTKEGGTTFGHGHGHGHGRGRAESGGLTFSVGRGRVNYGSGTGTGTGTGSVHNYPNTDSGEPSPFRYSRTKLLDIYRLTDITSSNKKILDVLMQVPSFTQEQPLEPLALIAPTQEESGIFKGIDKGEIVSSGAPPISKDGSTGRSSNDFSQTRRIKHGSRDDVSLPPDDGIDKFDYGKGAISEGLHHEKHHEKHMQAYGSDATVNKNENIQIYGDNKIRVPAVRDDDNVRKKGDEVTDSRDSGAQGRVYAQSASPWRSPSVEQLANAQSPNDMRSRSSDISWSQAPKDNSLEWGNVLPDTSYAHNELKWQIGEDSNVRKHPAVVELEQESRKLLHPSPEDLLLYYKDPQGQIQGPFTGSDIIGWFEAGYFGIDLQVRPVNAPNTSPFSLLGDVMPHLRAKARPPPGFNSAKQAEVPGDVSNRSILTGFPKVLPGASGISFLQSEHRHTHGSSTEAENRFLESLMSGDVSSMAPLGTESGEALNLLAQRMNLERQKSFTHPYSHWPTREGPPVVPNPDITRNSSMTPANLLPTVGDISRQPLSQNAEMMSILQGLSDRSSSGINNGLGVWPNFSVQGGIDPFKDNNKSELHHGQNFPPQVGYGLQQHSLQPQNPPPLTNLLAQQTLENPTMLPDKILSSGLTQDPQVLNLLQQQLLLQQLQSQQSAPGPQMSLLDKLLLIKQQQKQEEQQQLLRQQQMLLSQVLSEQQLAQRFGDPAVGQLQASASLAGNSVFDHSVPQLSASMFQMNSQTSVSGMPDDRTASIANVPSKVLQDMSHTVPTESLPLQLPHQMLGNLQQNLPSMSAHVDILKNNNLSSLSQMMENLATTKALERPPSAVSVENSACEFSAASSAGQIMATSVVDKGQVMLSSDSLALELPESSVSPQDNEILNFERANDAKLIPTGALEETSVKEPREEGRAANETNNAERREVKKTSDKKSRKVKSSKAQPSPEPLKGVSKGSIKKSKQPETEVALAVDKSEVSISTEATQDWSPVETATEISYPPENDLSTSPNLQSVPVNSAQRAWKPAVSVKPKSLLEIQLEEQKKAQMEIPASSISASVSPLSSSTPWAGVLAHVEPNVSREIHQDSAFSEHRFKSSKSKKSGLHDLLAAEVLAKSSDKSIEVEKSSSLPPLPTMSNQQEVVDDGNFIEAKDTKKSRKKAAKAKVSGAKVSTVVSSTDVIIASSPGEKGKSSKHVQALKEVLPAPPSGPSLGDFVPWKGESTSPSPAPAWSTDSGKYPKPTSLRDILKEQEKKVTPAQQQSPIATPQKPQSSQARPGSWSVSASSPSKAASPVQIHSQLSSQKSKGEDDLFWGPPDQIKQDTKQAVFPQLGNQGNWATKSTPSKATPGASISRQKSSGGRAVDNSVLSPPASAQVAVKGKRDGNTKHLEAMDFRDWCESESVRLTGSKDTSFLEFCSKQSRSEAQTLLIENLGSFDPNHEFIEKFLNYMELLSADVLELAFQSRNDLKAAYINGARDMNSDNVGFGDFDRDGVASADGSIRGKKKGKKGKKVSPSVLGFNVVSNRIMMGEIQTVED